jgi:hypothetical protein
VLGSGEAGTGGKLGLGEVGRRSGAGLGPIDPHTSLS